jgi:hypothetical protein
MRGITSDHGFQVATALWIGAASMLFANSAMADEAKQSSYIPDDWSMEIAPYVWAAGLEGDIAPFPRAPASEVDVSFKDILKHLDMAGMVFAKLRYQRFAGYADLIYTSISADVDTPLGVLFDDADAENDIFIGTFGGAYRAIESEHASLDLLVGARVWSVDVGLELHGGLLPDQNFETNQNWVDPVVGLQGTYRFDNGIFLASLLQAGGFGVASDLTWDAFGAVGYQFNDTISAIAGYRHLEVDYDHSGFVFDVELSGPVIGMTIRF